jgi:tetratricopeptide (TPR) repeat protein
MRLLLRLEEKAFLGKAVSRRSYFLKNQGAILMKKIQLTVVLGVAVVAMAANAAQPAQGQSAAPPAQQGQPATPPTGATNPPTGSTNPPTGSVNPPTGSVNPPTGQAAQSTTAAAPAAAPQAAPVIKDPAEYNAYVAAVDPAKDANARISGLEAFIAQYPNSVMKNQALEILMGTYQQANNAKKTMETATKLVTADACNERALALLAYFDRVIVQSSQANDPNVPQLLADGKKYGQQGLDCLPKMTDPELKKNEKQMEVIFKSAIGITDFQGGDFAGAVANLRPAVDANPTDFSVVYPLALAYLKLAPPDYQNGIWFAARAAVVGPAGATAGVEKYARSQYVKFHSADDGWADVLAAAKANSAQVPIKPAPTPAEQCHTMVAPKHPEDPTNAEDSKKLATMSFAEWQFAFTNCAQADQDLVWNAIKGKVVQMNGTVISTAPTEFLIAGSSDDIEAKKADITLKFEDKVPKLLIPKDGASFDFQGVPASYTPNPFMMVMEKGQLLKKATPKPATPVHHKAAAPAQ